MASAYFAARQSCFTGTGRFVVYVKVMYTISGSLLIVLHVEEN